MMSMDEKKNFAELMLNILENIGYGKLTQTNRAFKWIKQQNSNDRIDGPCIHFLKRNLVSDNFITLKEKLQFEKLEKENLPSEDEIDKELEKYTTGIPDNELYCYTDQRFLEKEIKQADQLLDAMEMDENFLVRQRNELLKEVKLLESKNGKGDEKIKDALIYAQDLNSSYNELVINLQRDLLDVSSTFEKLLNEDDGLEKENIFGINFESFENINRTLHRTINSSLQKKFLMVTGLEGIGLSDLGEGDSLADLGKSNKIPLGLMPDAEKLISIAESLGQLKYQNMELDCEETELNELQSYLDELPNKLRQMNINTANLKSLTDENFSTLYDLNKKTQNMSNELKKHFTTSIVKSVLFEKRTRLEQNIKQNTKYLKNLSDLSANFVNLLTLQACISHNEVKNVDWIIAAAKLTTNKLDNYTEQHHKSLHGMNETLQQQNKKKLYDRISTDHYLEYSITDSSSPTSSSTTTVSTLDGILHLEEKLLAIPGTQLRDLTNLIKSLQRLMKEVIFNGPVNQPFYNEWLSEEETDIMNKISGLTEQYNMYKEKYNEESKKANSNSYEKLQNSLGLLFLTKPKELRVQLQAIKEKLNVRNHYSANVVKDYSALGDSHIKPIRSNMST